MRKPFIFIGLICSNLLFSKAFSQSCTASFLYSGVNEYITFTNLSVIQDAHYFWDFGDGTGSNEENPIHKFPESGSYVVILYVYDTIQTCSDIHVQRIDVTSSLNDDVCHLYFEDTIYYDIGDNWNYLKLTNVVVSECSGEYINFDYGGGGNLTLNWNPFSLGPGSHLISLQLIGRLKAYRYYDSLNEYIFRREFYRTMPHNFSGEKNFTSCSANFEFIIQETDSGALVHFTSMGRNVESYNWAILGFGNAIYFDTRDFHFLYPYTNGGKSQLWEVWLDIKDSTGCRDTLIQVIRIDNRNYLNSINESKNFTAISLFPNPTSAQLTIQSSTFSNEPATISILNVLGEIVQEQKAVWKNSATLDVKTLPSGIYLAQVQNGKQKLSARFVKE